MKKTPNSSDDIEEIETNRGIVRKGNQPDGSYIEIEFILNEDEL